MFNVVIRHLDRTVLDATSGPSPSGGLGSASHTLELSWTLFPPAASYEVRRPRCVPCGVLDCPRKEAKLMLQAAKGADSGGGAPAAASNKTLTIRARKISSSAMPGHTESKCAKSEHTEKHHCRKEFKRVARPNRALRVWDKSILERKTRVPLLHGVRTCSHSEQTSYWPVGTTRDRTSSGT